MATISKKIYREYFEKIISGNKKLELRLADFEVNEGDTLVLEEQDKNKEEYTGRKVEVVTTYIFKTKGQTFWPQEEVKKYGFYIIQFEPKENNLWTTRLTNFGRNQFEFFRTHTATKIVRRLFSSDHRNK